MPSVKAVATIGAPAEPLHVLGLLKESLDEIGSSGEAEVLLAGRPFRVKQQFVSDLQGTKLADHVSTLERALLIFHSPVDTTVGIENAARLYGLAKHPKSFISLDDADHLVSRPEDSEYVGEVLATWARKYIDVDLPSPHEGHDHGDERVVVETGAGGYRSEIWASGHALVADEQRERLMQIADRCPVHRTLEAGVRITTRES